MARPTLEFMMSHPAHFIAMGLGSGLGRIAPGTVVKEMLAEKVEAYSKRMDEITENAKVQTVKHIARRADEMARGTVDTQTRAMEEAARVVFRHEVGPVLQRVTLPLQDVAVPAEPEVNAPAKKDAVLTADASSAETAEATEQAQALSPQEAVTADAQAVAETTPQDETPPKAKPSGTLGDP